MPILYYYENNFSTSNNSHIIIFAPQSFQLKTKPIYCNQTRPKKYIIK